MFEALGIASDLRPALVGAAFGTLATILVQYITHRYRLFMSFKRFKHDLRNLDRHIHASIESLNVPDGSPRYLIAARLRFCKFMDGMRSIEQLEWLTQRRDSDRILPTLLAIRNSDTFMEEIARRIDSMTDDEVDEALRQGQINMSFLHKAAEKLGYANSMSQNSAYKVPVKEILDELNDK
ncbi:hypothetical protein [uncultured Tateyamaria sp.]|uniref:hypothetical protein n=1 Tax=uncultured Tateyamaria sp. TaxID=455651 RepID=UPI001E194D6B|nr:hypothetical protein [uncultured Tateyamaria sp.]MCB4380132.1 hypothetical protein [Synechococcus sp. MU1644]